ncbi:hypothetical protein EG328_004112 [Venturia inaequalis]|uniref:Uncharacterized protein n=1 Tax=Venturia inaequalis TaxID=5025 RepID=A0A8H3Z5P5_VENIN|nr:hypothetical protein EG328_004112 [Venturia inaequalis]
MVTDSRIVEGSDTRYNLIAVWANDLGITAIEFLSSLDSISKQPGWLYVIVATTESIYVRSKGAFLGRLETSDPAPRRILWDSSQSPLLLQNPTLKNIRIPKAANDILLHYVPLNNSRGISLALRSARILAILNHEDTIINNSAYSKTGEDATWLYCPFNNGEIILKLWWVQHKELNDDWSALVVMTTQKVVWLGCYFAETFRVWTQAVQISSGPVRALFYSDPQVYGNQIIGAIPQYACNDASYIFEATPPSYRSSMPMYGSSKFDWFYSEAPLSSVVQVQLCVDKGFCIGLLLRYENLDLRTLGEFRFDKAIDCIYNPRSILCIQQRKESNETSNIQIEFSSLEPRIFQKTTDHQVYGMDGIMVWWFGKERSEIKILGSTT